MAIEYLDENQGSAAASAPTSSKFEYLDEPGGDYWGDVQKHAMEGVKEFPGMIGQMAEQAGTVGRGLLPGSVVQSGTEMLQGKPIGETPIGEAGKAAYQMGKGALGGAWQGVKDTGSLLKSGVQYATDDELPFAETEIGQKFRQRPISVPLGVAGTVGGMYGGLKGLRGEPAVPEVEGVAPEGGIPPETPPSGPGAPNVPPAGAVPPPTGPMGDLQGFVQRFKEQMQPRANDVKNYINRNVKSAMEQPGRAANLADLAQEKSQMMAVQAMGGSPLYATQGIRVGKTPIQINDELRAIGQYALDNKIVQPELGNKIMLTTQEALQKKAGETVGAVRMMADEMHQPEGYTDEMLQAVDNQIGARHAEGRSGSGPYQEALKIIQDHEPTYQGMADAATELNQLANKANRNHQPHTPYTEVANIISDINNQRIKSVVDPNVGAIYEQALREFGVNKKIQNMLGRKVGQGLHRTGPGTIPRAVYQKFLDEIGYKGGARVLNKLAGNIKANPSLASNLPELFKSFINEVEDILPDAESKAFGGIVGEMDAYLTPRYGAKK